MKQFLKWTLESIREEDSSFSWMEEYRYEWAPLAKSAITQSIEGKTALVVTDEAHEWFAHYMLTHINDIKKNRPLLPFYPLGRCFPSLPQRIQSTHELQLVEDMLEISYPNGYYIWYIGRGDHPYTKMAYRSDDSFLWIMDEEVPNSFALRSSDKLLDIKLLQLFKLFDATLSATLFGDLDLDS
jgi:hypothetical protein